MSGQRLSLRALPALEVHRHDQKHDDDARDASYEAKVGVVLPERRRDKPDRATFGQARFLELPALKCAPVDLAVGRRMDDLRSVARSFSVQQLGSDPPRLAA